MSISHHYSVLYLELSSRGAMLDVNDLQLDRFPREEGGTNAPLCPPLNALELFVSVEYPFHYS